MKKLFYLLVYICFINSYTLLSQESTTSLEVTTKDYKKRNPIYDYSENQLNNTDTIPGFTTKENKLKISGTIFQSDGVTPAKDVILYINQADENGDYVLKKDNHKKRYVHHRGWIKTNADGHYSFYTFVPGTYFRSNELKKIHPVIKELNKPEYSIDEFLFDNDPFLSAKCRSKFERKGAKNILKLEPKDGMFVATRNIVLQQETSKNN